MMNSPSLASRAPAIPRPKPSGMRPRVMHIASTELVEVASEANARRIAKPPSVPPPLPPRRGLAPAPSGNDLIDQLFVALAELDRQPDALAAARLCIDALAKVMPCRAMLVHAYDAARLDFVVVHAKAETASAMVLKRQGKNDPLLRVTVPDGQPFAWNDLRKAPVTRLARFTTLGQVRTVLVLPLVLGGRWLGAIELVDLRSEKTFQTKEILAARYVARRYAELVASKALVLEVGAIARFAARGKG